jgi:ferric-chelate reductase
MLVSLGVLVVAAPSADSTTSDYQAITYPKYVWSCVGSFIALVVVCRFVGLLGMRRRLVPSPSASSSRRDVIYYRRLPAAIMHTFRAIAFRWTISLGDSYTFNVAEVFLTAAYIAILLSWTFVNCMSHVLPVVDLDLY